MTASARTVLEAVDRDISFTQRPVGLAAIRETGAPYEPDLIAVARQHDAVLFGAATHHGDGARRPEEALFVLRKELDLYANIRPIRAGAALAARSPVRSEFVESTDLVLASVDKANVLATRDIRSDAASVLTGGVLG